MADVQDIIGSAFEDLTAPELMSKKGEIEDEIRQSLEVLDSQGGVGMEGALIDSDNFPRSDIDLYAVRSARQKIIRLRNDHKAAMKAFEKKLHELHAEAKLTKSPQAQANGQSETEDNQDRVMSLKEKVFARISMVLPGSPADQAELKNGDLILWFGSVSIHNFSSVADIGRVVQHSEGVSISVGVLRDDQRVGIRLVPKRWSGRGLLGCIVNPV